MPRLSRLVQVLSIVGLLAGFASAISIALVGDTFGFPGSDAYRAYETFNRVMAILLTLQTCALAAFYLQTRNSLPRADWITAVIALVAWIGMGVGTAAEFWLFSDLPYGADNMRSSSFSVFSLSSLISGLALFVLGLRVLLRRQLSLGFGVVLMLYLPVDILFAIFGQSIFLAAALTTIAVAGCNLVWSTTSQKTA